MKRMLYCFFVLSVCFATIPLFGQAIPEISDGLSGAVEYGTARYLRTSFVEEPVLGKTGTCSKDGTRFGWFASYANTEHGRIVTVIFLQGGRPTYGPKAAELAGHFYRSLYDHDYFTPKPSAISMGSTSDAGAAGDTADLSEGVTR